MHLIELDMNILLITQLCEPEPHFKGILFARELAKYGHEVQVLTGFPNYPGGKIYPGYRQKLMQKEDLGGGVSLARVPLYPSHDQSVVGRVLNYVTFFLSAAIFGLFVSKRPDVIYSYHPPLTISLAGVLIGKLHKAPVVCDIQDLWPDSLRTTGMINNERAIKFIGGLCQWVYKRCAHIVVLSPGFKKKLVHSGVPEAKVSVIPNWCDENSASIDKIPDINWSVFESHFTFVFAGNVGPAQDMDTVLNAAKLVFQRDPLVAFVIVGAGIDLKRLKTRVIDESIGNVVFIGQLSFEEIGSVLKKANVLLVHLKKDPLFDITIPSKIQSSMAAGKPLLMAMSGDSADIVREADCGVVVEPGDALAMAEAAIGMKQLPCETLREMQSRSAQYYRDRFSIQSGCKAFDQVFRALV